MEKFTVKTPPKYKVISTMNPSMKWYSNYMPTHWHYQQRRGGVTIEISASSWRRISATPLQTRHGRKLLTQESISLWLTANETKNHSDQIQHHHEEAWKMYDNLGKIDEATKNQVIETVKDNYTKEPKNKYTEFLEITCRDLLKHLINRCEKTTMSVHYARLIN